MDFKFFYFRTRERKGKPVREATRYNIGDWRSRWERKRDLEKNDPNKDTITKINTRGTDKDYIVTSVYGTSPDGLYFKGVPVKPDKKGKKKQGRHDLVAVRDAKYCKNCGNYVSTVKTGRKKRAIAFPFFGRKKSGKPKRFLVKSSSKKKTSKKRPKPTRKAPAKKFYHKKNKK